VISLSGLLHVSCLEMRLHSFAQDSSWIRSRPSAYRL
jgi:hypothetical protein